MRHIFILLAFFALPMVSEAQIFDFGFGGDPFSRRREDVKREPYTAPEYKGGEEKLNAFLKKNFKSPAGRSGLRGRITVACIVNEKGKVVETGIVQGLEEEYDTEAVRVAKKLKFKPAKRGKKKVKSRYDIVFPIRNGRLSFLNYETIDA